MIVPVTRMIIMTRFITNVYSTGYGIGTVFPFAQFLYIKYFILPMWVKLYIFLCLSA
jgi:hypothetical protein